MMTPALITFAVIMVFKFQSLNIVKEQSKHWLNDTISPGLSIKNIDKREAVNDQEK